MCCSFSVFSQKQARANDVILLKNGDSLSGEIIQYVQGDQLTLRLADGSELNINDSEIKRIQQGTGPVKEEISAEELDKVATKVYIQPKTEGRYSITQLSFAFGNSEDDGLALGAGFSTILGYQFSPRFGAGLGIGLDNYARRGETVYPVFVDLRSYFPSKKKPWAYYASVNAGYGFAFKKESANIKEAEGGYMVYPAVGYRTSTKEGIDVNFDIGVKIQKASFTRQLFNGDNEVRDLVFQRFNIRVGVGLWKKQG